MTLLRLLFLLLPAGLAAAGPAADNLLRNGSFEGGLLYWHNIDTQQVSLVSGDAPSGRFALRIAKGHPMSAPFVCERGKDYTISFDVKGERDGEVRVQMPPSAREEGQRARRLWSREGTKAAKIGTAWQRVRFTFPADVPASGFWPLPHYLVQIEGTVPLCVDGVTVTAGGQGTEAYVPRRPVEVVADGLDLPGYTHNGNLLARGADVRIVAHAFNPGSVPQALILRWQQYDYEGQRALGAAVEQPVTLAAGQSLSVTQTLRLAAAGCVLARVSAHASAAESALDASDLPLTSLPYPMAATAPDARERFGGSFAGGSGMVRKLQSLGFRWIRWRPHMNGEDHLPQAPADRGQPSTWAWRWFDAELAEQEAHGFTSHCVLYPPPKWIMEKGHPLPTDMRWPADDPRWNDLSARTAWDHFVAGAVAHYRGRALIYEIENEPELDGWEAWKDAYASFTLRTARLIKQVDPAAKVMVNNVYGIPSGLNRHLLQRGGAQPGLIDIISWHDYHAGWLTDATGIRRMRNALDDLGAPHIEIWFNEGWAFSNTAVDEPPACTGLTAVESVNALVASVAEMTVAGQEKTILFQTGYEQHGMSFWDYSGPGTQLWDWYNHPLPLAAAWNTLVHHISLSEPVGLVRPEGCNFSIFQDLRNRRGVMVAYADREAPADAVVKLPVGGLVAEDIMGNAAPLAGDALTLPRSGRPVFLYAADGSWSGRMLADALAPLDRKHASFVSAGGDRYRLPPAWSGEAGNPARAGDRPVWRLDQVWPPDPTRAANYRPLVWKDNWWRAPADDFGGQPKAEQKDGALRLEFRAPHGTPAQERLCGLAFIAPSAGRYALAGSAELRRWEGSSAVRLTVLHKTAAAVAEVAALALSPGQRVDLGQVAVALAAGEELVLLPRMAGMFNGGDVTLRDLAVAAGAGPAGGGAAYRLPAAWAGTRKGAADGNPIEVNGRPIWRIDQVWPDDPTYPAHYAPLPWNGTEWVSVAHNHGGQPAVRVENGNAQLSVRGAWTGNPGQKIAGLVFMPPRSALYQLSGVARSRPWEGGAKSFRLGVFKRDAQRATLLRTFDLPRDGSPVALGFQDELREGHELVLLPLMPDWHNATSTHIEQLVIREVP